MKCFKNIFSPDEIENAKNYKYNGKDDSIFAKLFLRKYWDFLIQFVPLTIAPNLITLIGFIFEVVSFIVSFVVTKGLEKSIPTWACIMNGVCLHIYQTLDNLDGRQARRTGSSSPLGQFFDHGCDAITGVLELMKVAMSFDMGNEPETFWLVFIMAIGFYLTSWEEYVTHAFYLGYINGPDEGLFLLAIGHILAGIFPSIRPFSGSPFTKIFFFLGAIGTIVPIFINVIKQINDREKAQLAAVSLVPAIISIILFVLSATCEISPVDTPYFAMSAGLVLQYQSQMTIVSYLTLRPPLRLFDLSVYGIWLFALMPTLVPSINEGALYWALFYIVILGMMIHFDLGVIFGLSRGLGIPALTLKEKEENTTLEIVPDAEEPNIYEEEEEVIVNVTEEVPLNLFQDAKEV